MRRAFTLLAFATLACAPPPPQPEATDAGELADAGTPIAHVMGFSGAANLPRDPAGANAFLSSMGYASPAAYDDDVIARLRALSAPMARGHIFYVGNGQFAPEAIIARLEAEDMDVYGWVNPAPPVEALDAQFDDALTALVKAHPKIRVWQLGNEPDLLWRTPSLFPAFFLRAQPLIRAACPDCLIALGGISNQYDSASTNAQTFEGFVSTIAAGAHTGPAFDIFDFHYYKQAPSRDELAAASSTYRAMLARHGLAGVRFWCTETGLYTGDPAGPQFGPRTEEDQARDLPKLVSWMAAVGVERVYNWTLIDAVGAGGVPGVFDSMGLIQSSGTPGQAKKAYVTYGLLARALTDVTGAREVAAGVVRFETRAGPAFVAWSENGSTEATLSGLTGPRVTVQPLVPDAQGQTPATAAEVVAGSVTISLEANPALVTPAP